jgi:hypothetical protein
MTQMDTTWHRVAWRSVVGQDSSRQDSARLGEAERGTLHGAEQCECGSNTEID